jgi:hypothetical protein
MTTPPTPTPAVGQVWQDNDPRGSGRRVRIVEIDGTHAVVEPVTVTPQGAVARRTGRRSRIRLDRLRPTSTGYRYITTT